MAFIRQYAARDRMMGDPFRFRLPKAIRKLRLPKAIRKFQPGRALGRLAPLAASFIPGIGGIASSLIPSGGGGDEMAAAPEPVQEQPDFDPIELLRSYFARAYGFDMGDPATTRRKSASAGPRAKAQKKAGARAAKAAGAPSGVARRRGGRGATLYNAHPSLAGMPAPGGGGLLSRLGSIAGGVSSAQQLAGLFGGALGKGGARGFGGGRRHINPTNVHALRRAIRRQEGFLKLVHRVAPTMGMKLVSSHAGISHGRRGRGHRAGCRCAVCARKR